MEGPTIAHVVSMAVLLRVLAQAVPITLLYPPPCCHDPGLALEHLISLSAAFQLVFPTELELASRDLTLTVFTLLKNRKGVLSQRYPIAWCRGTTISRDCKLASCNSTAKINRGAPGNQFLPHIKRRFLSKVFFPLQTHSSVGPPQVAHLLNANHFGTLPSKEEAKRIVTVPEHDAIRHVTN